MTVNLHWNRESYACLLEMSDDQQRPCQLELRIPRQFTYGGCSIPSGWLSMTGGTNQARLSAEQLAELVAQLVELARLFRCPLLLGDDQLLSELGLPFVTVLPRQFLHATGPMFLPLATGEATPTEDLSPLDPGLPELYGMALMRNIQRLQREAADWGQAGSRFVGWQAGEKLVGYACLQQGPDALTVVEAWSADSDYSPLCHDLAQSSYPVLLNLPENHPLAKLAFQAGALQCELWSGLQAWPLSVQQLLKATQRELSARLRESRFYQYSGEIGLIAGAEKICLHIVRGGVIDIHHREQPKPGWPTMELSLFLQAFFGSKSITEAVIADPSPTAMHLLDIMLTPRKG